MNVTVAGLGPGFTTAKPVTGSSAAEKNFGKFNVDWLHPILGTASRRKRTNTLPLMGPRLVKNPPNAIRRALMLQPRFAPKNGQGSVMLSPEKGQPEAMIGARNVR